MMGKTLGYENLGSIPNANLGNSELCDLPIVITNFVLRTDGSYVLRTDGSRILRSDG